jgi:general stress protein YciG
MASDNQGNPGGKSGKSNRGFASMDPQRQREIASEGGRAAHEKGTAHEFTSEEAREAGRKGGQARSANRKAALGGGSNSMSSQSAGNSLESGGSQGNEH